MTDSATTAVRPRAGTWELEPTHTTVGFIGRHLGLSRVRGRLTDVRATIEVGENLEASSAELWIEAASLDTGRQDA